jgi:hypothetical protein
MYRSGYSYKDPGQERILAITLTQPIFSSLLRKAVVATHDTDMTDDKMKVRRESRTGPAHMRVQWDPKRTIRLDKLPYRSIQIGVS